MKNVLITGHKGTIGQIIMQGLSHKHNFSGADLPEINLIDFENANKAVEIHTDVIIHLAWNIHTENYVNGNYDCNNSNMFHNMYKSALKNGVKRVIMASSIHAKDFYSCDLNTKRLSPADSPYGANKKFMEELGKVYSRKGIEVICIRFGGINLLDTIDYEEYLFSKIWLSKRDCCNLIDCCINSKYIPNRFSIITAVSNNDDKIHNTRNPFGWIPVDNSKSFSPKLI